jgi:hypothetical protein
MPTLPKQPDNPLSEVNTGLTDNTGPFLQVSISGADDQQQEGLSASKVAKQTYLDVLYDEWIFKLKQ